MNCLQKLRLRFRALVRKQKLDTEMEQEMRSHIEMQTQENIEAGMKPEEARCAALRQFGWTESLKETCRDQRGLGWIETCLQDVRFGVRMLRKNPGFTAVAVLTLALGIGANTAIFSFVHAILLRPLAYSDPERVVRLWSRNVSTGRRFGVSLPDFADWKQQSDSFQFLAYFRHQGNAHITATDRPEDIYNARVSEQFFNVLGTQAELGRTFFPEEDLPGRGQSVVISHSLWTRRYGTDPGVIGRTIALDGESHVICGVMPDEFSFPEKCELWQPYGAGHEESTLNRNDHLFGVIGRLKPVVSRSAMEKQLATIAARLEKQYRESDANLSVLTETLRENIFGSVTPSLALLFASVVAVLLIACANVANLLLARGLARQREIAVRAALGARRGRIIRQLLTESMLLSGAGALLGLAIAPGLIGWFRSLAPSYVPRVHETRLDGAVLVFTGFISLLTAFAFGLLPAAQVSGVNLLEKLKADGGALAGGHARGSMRGWLVIAEVAAAVVLLVGSGLFLRSLHNLENVKLGFDPSDRVVMRVRLPWGKYHMKGKDMPFFQLLRQRLASHPGFEGLGMACVMPSEDPGATVWIKQPGDQPKPGEEWTAGYNYASPSFFEAMGIPLLRGRDLSEQDTLKAPLVVVVDKSLAQQYFPEQDPLGKRLLVEGQGDQPYTVIGVVGPTRGPNLTRPPAPQLYFSYQQVNVGSMWLVARGAMRQTDLEKIVATEVAAMDPDQPVDSTATIIGQLSRSTQLPRFRTFLLAAMAAIALLLAVIGVYGIIAYAARAQRKELGVRVALGANRMDIFRLVIWQGGKLVAIGIAAGVMASLALVRVTTAMLYGVGPFDWVTWVAVTLLFTAVALPACWLPALRATRVNPMTALRSE